MTFLLFLISASFLTVVYYVGYFTVALLLGVHNKHYFLGFGKGFCELRIKGVVFTIGIFVPIFGLVRIYKIEEQFKKRPNYAWEFFEKPLSRRLITSYAGVFSLFLSSLIIFITIAYFVNDRYISKEEINKYGIYPSSLAELHGFQFGDRILEVNGNDFERYEDLLNPVIFETPGSSYTVLREEKELIVAIKTLEAPVLIHEPFFQVLFPFQIDSVAPNSPAAEIDLQKGDRIVKVNERKIYKLRDMQREFRDDIDEVATLEVQRIKNGDTITFVREVRLDMQKRIGVVTRELIHYSTKANSLGEALVKGVKKTLSNLVAQIKALFMVVVPQGIKGGPIGTSSAFGNSSWLRFWYVTATWSTGFILWNFLPYPKSTLWESVALAYEGVSRKKYAKSFFKKTLTLGWFIFFAQILWVVVNDIAKLF